jgi:uncharacterized protein with HEPN domain
MYDKILLIERFQQIKEQLDTLIKGTEKIVDLDSLPMTPEGMLQLNGICMSLLIIGEELKKIDQLTEKQLLIKYPNIPWREVIGMRNIIAHQYFDIDTEIIFDILRLNVPPLLTTILQIITDLEQNFE